MRRLAVLVALAAVLPACKADLEARVDGALLPQANGVVPSGIGVTVAVLPGKVPAALPPGPIKLAIDHKVPWKDVRGLLDRTEQAVFLVGQRNQVKGFQIEDHLDLGPALTVRALRGGKFCVSPPGTDQAYCLETGDRQHISALFARTVMKKAVETYDIHQARLKPDPDLAWADLVRAVDGARTCCPGMKVRVIR